MGILEKILGKKSEPVKPQTEVPQIKESDEEGRKKTIEEPRQETGIKKVSQFPSFDDFPEYFSIIVKKNFEPGGLFHDKICYNENLVKVLLRNFFPGNPLNIKAKVIYDDLIEKKKVKIQEEIEKIKYGEFSQLGKNKALQNLYEKEIFTPIFNDIIQELMKKTPEDEKMSENDIRKKIKEWEILIPSLPEPMTEASIMQAEEIIAKAKKYENSYTKYAENFRNVAGKVKVYLKDYLEGKEQMYRMDNAESLRARIRELCKKIKSEPGHHNGKEVVLLKAYEQKIRKMGERDDEILKEIIETLQIAYPPK